MKIYNNEKDLGQLYLYKVKETGGPLKTHTFCYYITPDISLWTEMKSSSKNNNGDITGYINLVQFSLELTLVSHNKDVRDSLSLVQDVKNMYNQLFNFLPTDHWMRNKKDFFISECLEGLSEDGLKCVTIKDDGTSRLSRLEFKVS